MTDTVARAEAVEAGIDAFIAQRHAQRVRAEERSASQDAATKREEAWKARCKRHEAAAHNQTLWEKLRYHEGQMRRHTATYEAIVGRHKRELERVEAMLGIDTKGDAA